MDFSLSEGQEDLCNLAKAILQAAGPDAKVPSSGQAEHFDNDLWGKLASANILGVALPERFGGLALGFVDLCLVLEQFGRVLPSVPMLSTLVLAAAPLAAFGTEAQQAEFLPGVIAGERILTGALTDHVGGSPTTARLEGGRWFLDGHKSFVPYAEAAEVAIVSASVNGTSGLFVVRLDASAVTRQPQRTMSGQPQSLLTFDGVEADLLGSAGQPDGTAVRWLHQRGQTAWCAVELGLASKALEMTANYTSERVQFKRVIATFQAVQHRLADAYIDVLAMRWTTYAAALRLEAEPFATEEVATAKWWACDGGHRVVSTAQHCHGGLGVDMAYPLHRYFSWSKQIEVTLGSGAQHLAELGRSIAAGSV